MGQVIWINGNLQSPDEARCSCLDRGLLYGDGLFETMRVYQGTVFRLDAHLQRLAHGAEILSIKLPLSHQELRQAVQATVAHSHLPSGYVRLTVTRGVGGQPSELDASSPSIMIWVRDFDGYPEELYDRGMSAILASTRRNEHSVLSQVKSLNYLDNLLARAEAKQAGADEAILLNTAGMLAEASASNLFIVAEGRLLTAPVAAGPLPGITRACIIELAAAQGVDLSEEPLSVEQLRQAQEAFLTNSLMEVMPLTQFERQLIGAGKIGPVTQQIGDAYRALVAAEISEV